METLNLGRMFALQNGDIIALKGHCDQIIEGIGKCSSQSIENFTYQKQVTQK